MSPHNYEMKFNGSHNKTIQEQIALAEKFDIFIRHIGSFLYTISGLRFFYTRRIFTRGVKKDKPFPEDLKNIPLNKKVIGPYKGMMIHPSYQKTKGNLSPNSGGVEV